MTRSREDFHLQVDAHAGRTTERPPRGGLSEIRSGAPLEFGMPLIWVKYEMAGSRIACHWLPGQAGRGRDLTSLT
jgi:hypothetical protein